MWIVPHKLLMNTTHVSVHPAGSNRKFAAAAHKG
jgi:hypothetical protein